MLLSQDAMALGRDLSAIGRIFLVGFAPAVVRRWATTGVFEERIGHFS